MSRTAVAQAAAASLSPVRVRSREGGTTTFSGRLPSSLRPDGKRNDSNLWRPKPLDVVMGTPSKVVRACRTMMEGAAVSYGLRRIEVAGGGKGHAVGGGAAWFPMTARIVYWRKTGYEIREAPVRCLVGKDGAVRGLANA
jgi:hypothetical protein